MMQTLTYATPAQPAGRPILAAVWIGIFGLSLIIIGGCFLIGILFMYENVANKVQQPFLTNAAINATTQWSPGMILFASVLYIAAFACFITSTILLIISIKKLLKCV